MNRAGQIREKREEKHDILRLMLHTVAAKAKQKRSSSSREWRVTKKISPRR